jgi:hypothetical protein
MDKKEEEIKKRTDQVDKFLDTLQKLRVEYSFRAETLIPDIAFVGLIDDCLDAGKTALELLESPRPYRAYSMVRVAFEANQRLLPLATSPDYVRLGTRAWLYYIKKDDFNKEIDKNALGPAAEQLVNIWSKYYHQAQQLAQEELAKLVKQKGPDNFLGRNLADVATECYSILALEKGNTVPSDSTDINRKFYASLSRDTHTCLRLEPDQLRIDADGFIEVKERPRDPKDIARNVITGLGVIFIETIAAINYRISKRRQENTEYMMSSLGNFHTELPNDYIPDLGLYLAQQGFKGVSYFYEVPIGRIAELPDGTLSTKLGNGYGPDARLATFDFKGQAREVMLKIIFEIFPAIVFTKTENEPSYVELPKPIPVTIKAELGKEQKTEQESVVPFIVIEVTKLG